MSRPYKMPRREYSFNEMFPMVCMRKIMVFHSRDMAIRARSAAHVYACKTGEVKFKTKLRETDAGLFELTITRVE